MNRFELLRCCGVRLGYQSYLEIGCNKDGTFRAVGIERRVGVDPVRGWTHRMTSDEFFAQNAEYFDLVFVDGLHLREQVLRDVENSLKWLNPGGCIVLHDCLPTRREQQLRTPPGGKLPWTGDVWKAIVDLRQRADLDLVVLDADWGLGVLFARPNSDRLVLHGNSTTGNGDAGNAEVATKSKSTGEVATESQPTLEWEHFVADRDRLLRVVNEAELWRFVGGGKATMGSAGNENAVAIVGSHAEGSGVRRSGIGGEIASIADDAQDPPISERRTPDPADLHPLVCGDVAPRHRTELQSNSATNHGDRSTMTVVFAHSNIAQFRVLHEYLNESGAANSYLICSQSNFQKYQATIPNLIPFTPHGGKLQGPESFYYLTRVEGANRRSLGIAKALRELLSKTSIDVFVGHVTAGSPTMFFDEFDFPIISYLEYPCFEAHGWDPRSS